MSDRDELARDLFLADNSSFPEGVAEKEWEENGEYHDYAYDIADALIAAGYRKPRTITTVEDLDAAIIRGFEEGEPLTLRAKDGRPFILWEDEDGTVHVTSYPQEGDVNPLSITDITLPAVTP